MKFSKNTLIILIIVVVAVAAMGTFWLQTPAIPSIQAEAVWSRPALMAEMDQMEEMGAVQTTEHNMEEMAAAQTTEHNMAGMEMDTGSRGVVYLTLMNKGRASDRLIGVQTDIATHAELHQTIMEEDGLMKMLPVESGLEIPAGGQVAIEPGGYHIMLMGLKQDLKVGERFPLVLKFEKSEPLTVESEVVER